MKSIAIIEAKGGHKITEFDVFEALAKNIDAWKGITCLLPNFKMSFTNLHIEYAYCPELHSSHADRILQLEQMRRDCAEAMQCICEQILTLQEFEKMNNKLEKSKQKETRKEWEAKMAKRYLGCGKY